MSEPLDWWHGLGEIGEDGLSRERLASEAECAALAGALDIIAVTELRAVYEIRPLGRARYRLTGDIEAHVTQACVVTLQPVADRIAERFEAEFMPAPELARAERQEEEEVEALAAADLEPIANDRIEVGRVVYEQVAAALDPYPRQEGARLELPGAREEGGEERAGPFSALAKLRQRR
jgi:uncharacterized metal-binding protein YceD (DUF177 family)